MQAFETSDDELARFRAIAELSLEDHRGVDVSQIRERLKLTPAERVERMVHEVRTWNELRARVQRLPT